MGDKTDYDLIIIGAGPAGMTAGVYAARKQLHTLILSRDVGGQATWSAGVENYLGFIFITGAELVQKFEEHLRKFDIALEFTGVTKLRKSDSEFAVEADDGRTFTSRAVIVASGKSPRLLNVPGEKEFTGRGVAYCSTCDGPLFAGQDVIVVGGGNSGLDAVVQLMRICPKVYLVEAGDELRADEVMQAQAMAAPNVEVLLNTGVARILGDQFVHTVVVEDVVTQETRDLEAKAIFIEVGLVPNTGFVKELVMLNKRGEIPVDCASRTGITGLYAAGDCTDVPEKQIICAAGDGAKAALGAYSYLVRLPAPIDWARPAAQ